MNFICLSETYLDSSIPSGHVSLELGGYTLVRVDHHNVKRCGVCIYYKESLTVRLINLPYLKEALLLKLNDQNKKKIISSLYRSPNQNSEEFESFLTNLNISYLTSTPVNHQFLSYWVILTLDQHSLEGSKLFLLSTLNGFHQIISEPTHV